MNAQVTSHRARMPMNGAVLTTQIPSIHVPSRPGGHHHAYAHRHVLQDSIDTTPVPLALAPRGTVRTPADDVPPPLKRAAVEAVSLLFHSILTEERIPAGIRLWFARLQIPVLRVASSEPDSFVLPGHPARRLVDRLGACAMGFDTAGFNAGDALEKEIKRVVQVVEAYPDTGKQVFEMVLKEFEHFLKRHGEPKAGFLRHDVSLLQQLDQRETLAVQYTIELRKVVEDIAVHESVRHFLFHVWADVMAMTAMRSGEHSQETLDLRHAAADLIRSGYLHAPLEQYVDVVRRLPHVLRRLRDGMAAAGLSVDTQDHHICTLHDSLSEAFLTKAVALHASARGVSNG